MGRAGAVHPREAALAAILADRRQADAVFEALVDARGGSPDIRWARVDIARLVGRVVVAREQEAQEREQPTQGQTISLFHGRAAPPYGGCR